MTAAVERRRSVDARAYRVIALATLLAIAVCYAVVFPVGEYAIDDDWAYVRALEQLQNEGRVAISDWNPMSLVGLLAWGWLFTSIFGLSFTVTKLSVVATLVIECGTLLALLRHFRVPALLAGLAMATLLFNPLHFFHAFQFTTDIPAITWSLLALYCYVRALDGEGERPAIGLLVLASSFAGLSFLVRQSGVLVSLALVFSLLVSDPPRLRSPWFMLAALGPVTLAVAVFTWWYHTIHGPTQAFIQSQAAMWASVSQPAASELGLAIFVIAIYVGLFVFPLTLAAPPPLRRGGPWGRCFLGLLAILGAGVLVAAGVSEEGTFPYLPNKLTPFGYMRPNEFILGNREVLWPAGTSWVLSALFLGSALLLVGGALRLPRVLRGSQRRGCWLLVTFVVGQLVYSLLTWSIIFDRHLLALAPTAILLYCVLVRDVGVPRPAVFGVLLLPFVFVSVAGTHDVHAISRTAFRAGEAARALGAGPRQIVAGYAFDGWHVFHRQRRGDPVWATPDDPWWVRFLMPTIRSEYVVSMTPSLVDDDGMSIIRGRDRAALRAPRLDHHRVIETFPYRRLWPYGEDRLYLLIDERWERARR